MMESISLQIRQQFSEADDRRDANAKPIDHLTCYCDIAYGTHPLQVLDIYRPANAGNQCLPVIVSVHGGGWVYGNKERYHLYCQSLSSRGFAVVNFSYRLAPEDKFPASLEDTVAVFDFVMTHSEEYHLDLSNLFAVGDSAGGHILGLYLNMLTDQSFASLFDFSIKKAPAIKAVALNCGAYDINVDQGDLTAMLMAEVLPNGGDHKELKMVNVLNSVNSHWPYVYIMTASGDFLKRDANKLSARLIDVNVPFIYRFYDDGSGQLGHVFMLNMTTDIAKQCNDDECQYFKSFID